MDYYEEIKKIKDNFKCLYFSKSNSTLILSNNTKRSKKECIEEIDKSIPVLKKFLLKKKCPITTLKIKDCLFLNGINHREYTGEERNTFGELMDILKENRTITELELKGYKVSRSEIIDLCDFLRENRILKKLRLNIMMGCYIGPILESLVDTSVIHLDIHKNRISCKSRYYFKRFLPFLKLKFLDIRDNNNKNKCFQEFFLSCLYKNIFLEKVKVENLTEENKKKLDNYLQENHFIKLLHKIYLKNYSSKRLRTDLYNKLIPSNIEEIKNFIFWLNDIKKYIDKKNGYNINNFIYRKNDINFLKKNKEKIKSIIDKLKKYIKIYS